MGFNILDAAVIAILLFFIIIGRKKGFVLTIFNFLSSIAAFILSSYILYPVISSILKGIEAIYVPLKNLVSETLGISEFIQQTGKAAETQLIESLSLPGFIKQYLVENNNPEIYKILDVSSLDDYISGLIANLLLSAAAMVISFIIAIIIVKAIGHALNILTKLPIINSFNKIGGAIVGFFQGIILLWILATFSLIFLASSDHVNLFEMIENSMITRYFYEYNLILDLLLKWL